MRRHIRHGIEKSKRGAERLVASTFVELVATMLLLTLFAILGFSLYWGSAKASASQAMNNAVLQAKLSLATYLPRLAAEVRPPYWLSPDAVFQSSGNEWKASYLNGDRDDSLILRTDGPSRLSLITPRMSMTIDNLPDLAVDWWQKDGRIIGVTVHWRQGDGAVDFHAAWGTFIL